MPVVSRVSSWWRNHWRKQAVERDLDEELRSYLELLTAEKVKLGMTPENARRSARLELGGVEQVKEKVREARSGALFDTFLLDLRHGARLLARSPGFAVVAILALALGIGANSALYSVIDGVLLRPLPYSESDRIAYVSRHFSKSNFRYGNLCIADYLDWRAGNRAFLDPALMRGRSYDLTGGAEAEEVAGAEVTSAFFSVLRVRPLFGRTFRSGEDGAATAPLAVISESLWRRRYGGRPETVGQAIEVSGKRMTVVGVMPAAFHFPRPDSELWTNLLFDPPTRRGPFFYRGIARLRPGVSLRAAQAELDAIAHGIEHGSPWTSQLSFPAVPLREAIVGESRFSLLVLFGAVSLVLLIAAVNVANLLLARATAREREMAVRLGLGAGRARLLRQLLTESGLLALLGGAAGVALAALGIELLRRWNPGDVPRIHEVALDLRVVAFTLGVSLATGLLFGLAPALHGSRAGLASALKEGGRGSSSGRGRSRTRAALVVCEIALSLLLLAGASLFLRSFLLLREVKTSSLPPSHILTLHISASGPKYAEAKATVALYEQLVDRVRQLPGVECATVSDSLPPDREGDADTYVIAGRPLPGAEVNPVTTAPTVGREYFQTLGIPLLRGRVFDRRDTLSSPPVALISEAMARRDFQGQDPLGQRIKASGPEIDSPYMEIVGVVGNTRYLGLAKPLDAAYYQAFSQGGGRRAYLAIRTTLPATQLAPPVRREIRAVDRDLVITHVTTMEQELWDTVAQPRFRTFLLAAFAVVAVTLAAIGIYGLMAFSVAQRTHEIGVRMALGARRADVMRMIVGQGAHLTLAGIGIGLVAALGLTRLLGGLLFGVSASDPLTFCVVPLMLASVALAASLVPARRATLIAPQDALKDE
jgi:putative ABC transport system permease protein